MARITVWLFIEAADLTSEEISARIGLPPDASWRIGDLRGRTGKVYETNSWSLRSAMEVNENPLVVGESVRACLNGVLRRVRDNADRFKSAASGQIAGLYIGITAVEPPALELKADEISTISALGVDVEIDLML